MSTFEHLGILHGPIGCFLPLHCFLYPGPQLQLDLIKLIYWWTPSWWL